MRQYVHVFVLIILVALCGFFALHSLRMSSGTLSVSFLNVGQGDAIFIESPTGVQVLIDGGPDTSVLTQLDSVMPLFDNSIHMVVGTHPDNDHITGLIHVLRRMHIDHIVYSGVSHNAPGANYFDSELQSFRSARGGNIIKPHAGDIVDIGGGAFIQVLYPMGDISNLRDTNDTSLVVRVKYGRVSFLLTGDAPQYIEEKIVRTFPNSQLKSTVLKLGHHGSETSSSEIFLRAIQPEYVVISRGCENMYGHPHKQVLNLLSRLKMRTYDTCGEGTVTFSTDGISITKK